MTDARGRGTLGPGRKEPPVSGASPTTQEVLDAERQALAYLRDQLGERCPQTLSFEGVFDEQALEGEGRTLIFSFHLPPTSPSDARCAAPTRHYVAVGQTEPNYFPDYGLHASDAYSFHLGTRFMLVLGVQKVDPSLEPPGAREQMRKFLATYAAGQAIENEQLAGLFRCQDSYFAVYRVRIAGQDYYVRGADCPPGCNPMRAHPPQAALRLHLGKVVRHEARMERQRQTEQR